MIVPYQDHYAEHTHFCGICLYTIVNRFVQILSFSIKNFNMFLITTI